MQDNFLHWLLTLTDYDVALDVHLNSNKLFAVDSLILISFLQYFVIGDWLLQTLTLAAKLIS